MKKRAFTLAEVLIALVIIGVVAAITIPLVHANVQKERTLARTKKAYSVLSQMIFLSRHNNGPIEEWYEIAEKKAPKYYELFFKPFFHSSVLCLDYEDCGYDSVTPWKSPNGSVYNWYISNEQKSRVFFYMSDGTFVAVQTGSYPCVQYDDDGNCIKSELAYAKEPTIIFDINGSSKPNIIGKDVFFMQFNNEKGAIPYCSTYTVAQVNNSCKKKGNAHCCLKKMINDAWDLKENYPI